MLGDSVTRDTLDGGDESWKEYQKDYISDGHFWITDPLNCATCAGCTAEMVWNSRQCPSVSLGGCAAKLDIGKSCEPCGFDAYCHDDDRFSCPESSLTHGTLSSHILDCQCRNGHHRVFATGDASVFTCPRCEPGDWCFNNSAYNCSDARMSTTHPAFRISNCTCEDGWYNNDDDTVCIACPRDSYCQDGVRYNCSVDHWTNNQQNVDNPDGCLCRPGLTPDPTNTDACVACPQNTYCFGDEVVIPCRNFSLSPAGSVRELDCKCDKGYGYVEGACQICVSEDTFKDEVANTACTDCYQCGGADGDGKWESEVCTIISNTKCSPCITCSADEYVFEQCSPIYNTDCDACKSCPFPLYELEPCKYDEQTVCKNVTFYAVCPADKFRGGHTTHSDSLCLPCQSRHDPYMGTQLHTYVASEWSYNDPFSCGITCLGASRMLDASNHSLGCTTCETGNVLFKVFSEFDRNQPTVCQYACRSGFVADDTGNCVLSDLSGRTQPNISITDIIFGDHDTASQDTVLVLNYASLRRFAIVLSNQAPECPLHGVASSQQCCWPGAFLASSMADMGLTAGTGPCADTTLLATTQVDASTRQVHIPRAQLGSIANCSMLANAVRSCRIVVTQFDMLTARQFSASIELRISSSTLMAVVPTAQLYIPLQAFDVSVAPAFKDPDGSTVFRVVTTVTGHTEHPAIDVGIRVRGMTRYARTVPAECSHMSHTGINNTSPAWQVNASETVTTTTYWKGQGTIVRAFYALRTEHSVMDIAAYRDVTNITLVCGPRHARHTMEGGLVRATIGLGRQAVAALSGIESALNSQHAGILGNLITLFATARTSSYTGVTVRDVLAVSTLQPTHSTVIVDSQNGRLELNRTDASACLQHPNCTYEYLNSNPALDLSHIVQCTTNGKQLAREWIIKHFKVYNHHEHVDALCERVSASPHISVAVLLHALASMQDVDMEAYKKWGGFYGPIHTQLFANVQFH